LKEPCLPLRLDCRPSNRISVSWNEFWQVSHVLKRGLLSRVADVGMTRRWPRRSSEASYLDESGCPVAGAAKSREETPEGVRRAATTWHVPNSGRALVPQFPSHFFDLLLGQRCLFPVRDLTGEENGKITSGGRRPDGHGDQLRGRSCERGPLLRW
jgi:hypothetical protein